MFTQGESVGNELERHDIGAGGSHRDQGVEPGSGRVGHEFGVTEFLHPVEVVVDGVVNPISAMKSHVDAGTARWSRNAV